MATHIKTFLSDNVTRCNNIHCTKRNGCRKFSQYKLDIYLVDYSKKTINYNEKDCKYYSSFDKK